MSALSPPILHRLDLACGPVAEAFNATPYLVGSVQERTSKAGSDVDVRVILADKAYDRLMKGAPSEGFATFLDFAVSAYLREMTGLPIDFQVQRMTQANPLGCRKLTAESEGLHGARQFWPIGHHAAAWKPERDALAKELADLRGAVEAGKRGRRRVDLMLPGHSYTVETITIDVTDHLRALLNASSNP